MRLLFLTATLSLSFIAASTGEETTAPIVSEAAPPVSTQPKLPTAEEKIRTGIMLLAGLHDTMAGVKDKDSAEAAVAPIMRFISQLQNWGNSFNTLPPPDEETRQLYEQRYLPIIRQLNERIQAQADRLASAEYYGSRNLPAALIQLVSNFQ